MTIALAATLPADAIVHGSLEVSADHPEVVRLLISEAPQAPAAARLRLFPNSVEMGSMIELSRCSGVVISDSQVLTAGHCVVDVDNKLSAVVLATVEENDGSFRFVEALKVVTPYRHETFPDEDPSAPVPGCSARMKPVVQSATPDLAIVRFAVGTFYKKAEINLLYAPEIPDAVEFFGFGSHDSSFSLQSPTLPLKSDDLRRASNQIWRFNSQRLSFLATGNQNFADQGDSGGPVFVRGKLVGILSTESEKCETELGSDYGIQNTAMRLSDPTSREFLQHELAPGS